VLVDMQGRLMGKRFHVQNFIESSHEETHCCNYMLATDLEMATPDGYATTSWQAGYGDYVMQPDLSTLRPPALAGRHGDGAVRPSRPPYPQAGAAIARQILKVQIARLKALGFTAMMATELEFFLFEQSFRRPPPVGLPRPDADQRATTRITTSCRRPRKSM
jgi:glutamine synthetase